LGILDQLFSQFLQQDSGNFIFPGYSIQEEDARQTLKALIDVILWQHKKDTRADPHLNELFTSWLELVEIELAKEMLKFTPSTVGVSGAVEADGEHVGTRAGKLQYLHDYLRGRLAF
jgi:hypothetical protein